MSTELLYLSALEQARLIRDGALSSEELVRFYLRRIEALDPQLCAFASVTASAALRDARRKDAWARHTPRSELPAFHGVPTGIKDLNFARGTFTRMGSRAWRYLWSPVDDVTTARLRASGFVILGKTTTSELGTLPVTEPTIHAPTRNPWNLEMTPGGSSGGSAAAVAAGMLPIAQGSDGAGSIRIPASFCHLFGFKPSRGALPNPYLRVDSRSISVVGPLARSVDDAAAMMDAMAVGRSRSWLDEARVPPRPLRIKLTLTAPVGEVDSDVVEATRGIARALESLGHAVEERDVVQGRVEEFLPIWQLQTARIPILRESVLQPVTRWLRSEGRGHREESVAAMHRTLTARIEQWFGDADLWITPTVPVGPPRVGAWSGLEPRQVFEQAARLGPFTAPFNLSGQPAASIPAGISRTGMPIGVQLVGRVGQDGLVLAIARQLESAHPWAARRSAMFA